MPTGQLINPATFLSAAALTLEDLLSTADLAVPPYQRDFSWTQDQVSALWDDLRQTCEQAFLHTGLPVHSPIPHFLGPIVLQAFPQEPSRALEVMDGQQRLVTISALVSVLHEFVASGDPAIVQGWPDSLKYLLGSPVGGAFNPRLRLARDDQHYAELICRRLTKAGRDSYYNSIASPSPVTKRLHDTVDWLYTAVDQHLSAFGSTSDRDRAVVRLAQSLCGLSVFLRMQVQEQGVAYEVFEGLNARGLELQQADLLKNRLFQLADQQGTQSQVTQAWKELVASIEGQSTLTLTEFLHFHHLVRIGDAKLTTLYANVNRYLGKPGVLAVDYAQELARVADGIQQLLDTGSSLSSACVEDIEAIRDALSNKYALVVLVAGLQRHTLGSAEMDSICRLAHRFAFRRFLVEGQTQGKYASEVVELARNYAASTDAPSSLAIKMRSKSTDAAFVDSFKTYSSPTNKIGFYVLERIENHLSASAGTFVHRQSPSQHLEHILPKKPGPGWGGVELDPQFPSHVQRLGNLLVLEADINRSIKNKDYAHKKSNATSMDYAHSHLQLPHSLTPFEGPAGEWAFSSIEARQDSLATTYAATVWNL